MTSVMSMGSAFPSFYPSSNNPTHDYYPRPLSSHYSCTHPSPSPSVTQTSTFGPLPANVQANIYGLLANQEFQDWASLMSSQQGTHSLAPATHPSSFYTPSVPRSYTASSPWFTPSYGTGSTAPLSIRSSPHSTTPSTARQQTHGSGQSGSTDQQLEMALADWRYGDSGKTLTLAALGRGETLTSNALECAFESNGQLTAEAWRMFLARDQALKSQSASTSQAASRSLSDDDGFCVSTIRPTASRRPSTTGEIITGYDGQKDGGEHGYFMSGAL